MKIAITGGTGFVGSHLAKALIASGHQVVLIARGVDRRDMSIRELPGVVFVAAGVDDVAQLTKAFEGCSAVAHCAGINRESGSQTYRAVHIEGTQNVVNAAKAAGVGKIALISFLRARPNCGSPYHESKWAAEEIVRNSGLDYVVLKEGITYGQGDHMLSHLSWALRHLPVFAFVGFREKPIRPVAVADLTDIICAGLAEGRLSRETVAVVGPEEMLLSEAVRRVAKVLGSRPLFIRLPIWSHKMLALVWEKTMRIPLASRAQVFMLSEGIVEAVPATPPPPPDLAPKRMFTDDQIREGLPSQPRPTA